MTFIPTPTSVSQSTAYTMPRMIPVVQTPARAQKRRFYPSEDEPSSFVFQSEGRVGVNLEDAYKGNVHHLDGKGELMFKGFGKKVTYIVYFNGTKYTKQKYAQNTKCSVTKEKAVKQIAQVIWDAMREELRLGDCRSTTLLKEWYLIELERVGKSSFVCILERDTPVQTVYNTIGNNLLSSSHRSAGHPGVQSAATPSPEFPCTVPAVSSTTKTTTQVKNGSSGLGDDAAAVTKLLRSVEGYLQRNLADRQVAQGSMVASNRITQQDTSSPTVARSITTEQDITTGPVHQRVMPRQPQTTPPPPIFAASVPAIFSADMIERAAAPYPTTGGHASHMATAAYAHAAPTDPTSLLPQRRALHSPMVEQAVAASLTGPLSATYPSYVASTTEAQPLPMAGPPSDFPCFDASDYSLNDLDEFISSMNAGSLSDCMSGDGAAGADTHAYI